jgi:hypothetical protein
LHFDTIVHDCLTAAGDAMRKEPLNRVGDGGSGSWAAIVLRITTA